MVTKDLSRLLVWVVVVIALVAATACSAAQPAPAEAPKAQPKAEAPKASEPAKPVEKAADKAAAPAAKPAEKAAEKSPAASKPVEPAKVRLAMLKGTQMFPVMVMLDQGLDKKHGLAVDIKSVASPDAINIAMRSKDVDVSFNGWFETVKFRAQGVKIISAYPYSAFVNMVVAKKDSPLNKLEEIKGKKLGTFYNASTTSAAALRITTRNYYGFDAYEDTQIQQGAKPLIIGLLDKGDVEAIYLGEPDAAMLTGRGTHKSLASIADIWKAQGKEVPLQLVIQMQEDFAEKNPQAAKGLVTALHEAVAYLKAHPELWPKLAKEIDITEPKSADLLKDSVGQAYFGKAWDKKFIDQQIEFAKDFRKTVGPDALPDVDYVESFSMKYLP